MNELEILKSAFNWERHMRRHYRIESLKSDDAFLKGFYKELADKHFQNAEEIKKALTEKGITDLTID